MLALSINANSQTPDWAWAKRAGGINYDGVRSVATDASGNAFVVGWFSSSTIIFGSDILTNPYSGSNTSDMFLAKYDANGNVLWAKRAGGTNWDDAVSIAIDANDNIYVTGGFYSPSIIFGNDTLMNTSSGTYDVFIVKYSATGDILWAKSTGGNSEDIAHSIAIDNNGNVLVTGWFASYTIIFGSTTLTNVYTDNTIYAYDMFLVKYDTNGNVLWAKSAGGTKWDCPYSVAADANGNSYVAGYFYGPSLTFNSLTITNSDSTGSYYDIFLAKYDVNGNILWAKSAGGTYWHDEASSVAVDANGNVCVTGNFISPTIIFGSDTLTNPGSIGFTSDMFLTKYDTNGNVLWAKSAGGTNYEGAASVATDATGNILVAGSFASLTITFGSTTLNNTNNNSNANIYDVFLAKYDTIGNVIWAKSVGDSTHDNANSVVTDANGNIILTGNFESPSITFGSTVLTNAGSTGYTTDMFIAKLDGPTIVNELSNRVVFSLYPNPNDGNMQLDYNLESEQNGKLIIYDIIGQKIKNYSLLNDRNTLKISDAALKNGIYFYEILINDEIINSDKLIIIK